MERYARMSFHDPQCKSALTMSPGDGAANPRIIDNVYAVGSNSDCQDTRRHCTGVNIMNQKNLTANLAANAPMMAFGD
ncbi:hypothetical protein K227x_51380 [Rubripirellula lacrimiformis]|uniref:Uncharacterized protein n=1 Tax=Rubripirellula lacrimiformis TaxID=1930273 RepID=A0A517NHW4_9BACT|nr:hypothetical protein K227x_51380 [Rubripirellula lacrimiformis]